MANPGPEALADLVPASKPPRIPQCLELLLEYSRFLPVSKSRRPLSSFSATDRHNGHNAEMVYPYLAVQVETSTSGTSCADRISCNRYQLKLAQRPILTQSITTAVNSCLTSARP